MTFYEELVIRCQQRSAGANGFFSYGRPGVPMSEKASEPYEEQIKTFVQKVREADCVIVGGASGLSAAGGGDFYYEDNESYRKYFGKFAEMYGFKGAFAGMMHRFPTREEHWGYVATFLNATLTAPIRKPYLDLDAILKGKDFFVLTTNQDTQFVKIYPEEKVAEIQGDHRFFQCAGCCTDDTWDAVEPVRQMMEGMGDSRFVPTHLIPRCPHCGGEAFPWVRGYGNFLDRTKYTRQYRKISDYILKNQQKKILFLEMGVGRMTPMFIQEPFWYLAEQLPQTSYIAINNAYSYLPKSIEERGMVILADIGAALSDAAALMAQTQGGQA